MESLFAGVLTIVLLEVAALYPIVNPVSTAPIFLSLTRGASAATRTSTVNVFLRLSSFLLLGIGVQILANGVKALKLW